MGWAADVWEFFVSTLSLIAFIATAVASQFIDWEANDGALAALLKDAYLIEQAVVVVIYLLQYLSVVAAGNKNKIQMKDGKHITITTYDLRHLRNNVIVSVIATGFVFYMYHSSDMVTPAFMHLVLVPINFAQDEMTQIHIFRFRALKPPLLRPWDESGNLIGLLNPSTFKQEMRQFKKELAGDAPTRGRASRRAAARQRTRRTK